MPELNLIFQRLDELQNINIVQKAMEVVKDNAWGSYKS